MEELKILKAVGRMGLYHWAYQNSGFLSLGVPEVHVISLGVPDEHAISLGVPVAISLGVPDAPAISLGVPKVHVVTRSVPDILPGRRPLCNFMPDCAAHNMETPGDGSRLFHALSFGLRALVGAAPTAHRKRATPIGCARG